MSQARATRAEWDGAAYHRLGRPQLEWGLRVLSRLVLQGDEYVLDAGCGSGRLTAELLQRLPNGACSRWISPGACCRRPSGSSARTGGFSSCVRDLAALPLVEAVDVVFSNATLHWLHDHDRLFVNQFRVLKPGGRIQAQCGEDRTSRASANAPPSSMRAPDYARSFERWREPWNFADPITTAERLRTAGFRDIETGLEPAPTRFDDEETYRAFLVEVVIAHYLAPLPDDETRARFTDALVAQARQDDPPLVLDYWRLNLSGPPADVREDPDFTATWTDQRPKKP
jgi:SAM-dependent methyltransferase